MLISEAGQAKLHKCKPDDLMQDNFDKRFMYKY